MRGQVNILDAKKPAGRAESHHDERQEPDGLGFAARRQDGALGNDGDGTVTVLDLEKALVVRSFQAGVGIETLGYY